MPKPMDTLSLLTFLIAPLAMGLGGFAAARRFRAFGGDSAFVGFVSSRKSVFSAVMGIFMGFVFTLFSSPTQAWSAQHWILFLELSALSAIGYHAGISFGWGAVSEPKIAAALMMPLQIASLPANIRLEEMPGILRITIQNTKKRGWFVAQWFLVGFLAFPFLCLLVFSFFQSAISPVSQLLLFVFVLGVFLYLAWLRFHAPLEQLYDREVIEINELAVQVELYGAGFKSREKFSARDILRITTFGSLFDAPLPRSSFSKGGFPALLIWKNRGLKRMSSFGKGVALPDAQQIVDVIYQKFPQYKG